MSRIKSCFERLQQQGRKALIPYITAGDPNPQATVPLMHRLVEAGADIVELGVPFSDPMADGPVIQLACERALAHQVSLANVLEMVAEFRKTDSTTPVVLMGYLNPIEAMGAEQFAERARAAGVDGVLTVDLPPEEADSLVPVLRRAELDTIFLLAPTTTEERIRSICEHSTGFVYYVSLKGVTGSNQLNTDEVAAKLGEIRKQSSLPIGVGFGIRDAQTAAAVASVSDAVIVGSALVKLIEQHQDDLPKMQDTVAGLLASMRAAIDA